MVCCEVGGEIFDRKHKTTLKETLEREKEEQKTVILTQKHTSKLKHGREEQERQRQQPTATATTTVSQSVSSNTTNNNNNNKNRLLSVRFLEVFFWLSLFYSCMCFSFSTIAQVSEKYRERKPACDSSLFYVT